MPLPFNHRGESFADTVRRGRWRFRALLGKDVHFPTQFRCDIVHVGGRAETRYGAWAVCPESLTSESIVYAFGIGDEISFDLDLARRFGIHVHAFDPTPASHAWLETQDVPDTFEAHPYGLAHYDGHASFYAPSNPEWISHSMLAHDGQQSPKLDVPVYRLETIMKQLGHAHVDLLKMDIEGAEYEVIEDIVADGLDVRQLLVEFHHRFDSVPASRTAVAVHRLNEAGYQIAHVSPRGEEYTFVRTR